MTARAKDSAASGRMRRALNERGTIRMRKNRLLRATLTLLCAMALCFAGACRDPKNDGETETGAEQPAQSESMTESVSEAPSEPESETTSGTDDEKNWTPFY